MTTSEMFSEFLQNLVIDNRAEISGRYERITAALNKRYRDTESKTANSLQVGSFGRSTGIRGISDLDMIYIMPKGQWGRFKDGGQLRLLQDVQKGIKASYPTTETRVDRLVVVVTFDNFEVEVQPCFEEEDGSFLYPDTYAEEWRNTNPRAEMDEVSSMDDLTNGNLRDLCKMGRAWKNKHGLKMGGLLLDTLAYQCISQTNDYDETSYGSHDQMVADFFHYLANEPTDQEYYRAPGSQQHVRVKKKFQRKARKAHGLCLKAIEAEGQAGCNDKWAKVFGRPFPKRAAVAKAESFSASWDRTEEFIEDRHPVDIRFNIECDCTVEQDGFRPNFLRAMLRNRWPLRVHKKLTFSVTECDVPEPFDLKWKVLNRGDEARRRNCVRGQIVRDKGNRRLVEHTSFKGNHIVECYAIRNNVVVAKDRIDVPIEPE